MKTCLTLITFICFLITARAQQTVGLFTNDPGSLDGYILFAPTRSDTTYLIDKCGKKINEWSSTYNPGLSVYLLSNGNLLRSGFVQNPWFTGPGGAMEIYNWDDSLIWSYVMCDSMAMQNHDIYPMPNGNIMVVIWEKHTAADAINMGRNPNFLGTSLWCAKIVEIEPVGSNQATIFWEWDLWDHLVQHFDMNKSNYAVIEDHPELLNINFSNGNPFSPDWTHMNAVAYNEALDQIVISAHTQSEIYIIDHSTTTGEAATHTGGNSGKGGDFLYRWGNPMAYNRGLPSDQRLFSQHSPYWIPAGYKDANKIMIFNNGVNRPASNYSSVDIIAPPMDSLGNYIIDPVLAFGPVDPEWSYVAQVPGDFYSGIMGGSERLSNGNTLICESTKGNFFEVDSADNIVWRYVNPVNNAGVITQGVIPTGNNSYRSLYYPASYSGFIGKNMTPGDPIELNPLPYVCTMLTSSGAITENVNDKSLLANNPFNEVITLESKQSVAELTIELFSSTGQLVLQWTNVSIAENSQLSLPLNKNLSNGSYFLKYSNKEINGNLKLIKVE